MPLTIRFVTRYSHVTARGGLMCDETIEKACVWTGGVRESECVYRILVMLDGAHRAVLDTNLCLHVVRRSGPGLLWARWTKLKPAEFKIGKMICHGFPLHAPLGPCRVPASLLRDSAAVGR